MFNIRACQADAAAPNPRRRRTSNRETRGIRERDSIFHGFRVLRGIIDFLFWHDAWPPMLLRLRLTFANVRRAASAVGAEFMKTENRKQK